jgi:hypothetical protein
MLDMRVRSVAHRGGAILVYDQMLAHGDDQMRRPYVWSMLTYADVG